MATVRGKVGLCLGAVGAPFLLPTTGPAPLLAFQGAKRAAARVDTLADASNRVTRGPNLPLIVPNHPSKVLLTICPFFPLKPAFGATQSLR